LESTARSPVMVAMAVTVVTVGIRTLPACWAVMVAMAVRAPRRRWAIRVMVAPVAMVARATSDRREPCSRSRVTAHRVVPAVMAEWAAQRVRELPGTVVPAATVAMVALAVQVSTVSAQTGATRAPVGMLAMVVWEAEPIRERQELAASADRVEMVVSAVSAALVVVVVMVVPVAAVPLVAWAETRRRAPMGLVAMADMPVTVAQVAPAVRETN
jgi:hypothetical protein